MTTILNYSMIKKVLIVLPFYLFTFLPLSAQTYTQRIQQQNGNGQGSVTIHQDADIDKLVNSEVLNNSTKQTTTTNQPATSHTATTPGAKTSTTKPTTSNSVTTGNEGEDETTPDLTKKVMRGGTKVNGYRVQAFAGGNSRNDRIQAERIGNNIKSHFANVPVYVHFYSPRWICRVGNYRTYEEAHQMLVQLRNLGYNQASIVKGKITVQY
jgi:hypothetical protein